MRVGRKQHVAFLTFRIVVCDNNSIHGHGGMRTGIGYVAIIILWLSEHIPVIQTGQEVSHPDVLSLNPLLSHFPNHLSGIAQPLELAVREQ